MRALGKRAALTLFLAFCLTGLLTGLTGTEVRAQQKIQKGVRIGSVDVGGMTRGEAEKTLGKLWKKLRSASFELTSGEGSMSLSAEEMGVEMDVSASVEAAFETGTTGTLIDRFKQEKRLEREGYDLKPVITLDRQRTAERIYEKREELSTQAEDNRVIRENGSFTYIEGKSGIAVDEVESVYAIEDALLDWNPKSGNRIDIVTRKAEPRGKREELEQIQDVLGEYSTDYSSSSSQRATNVQNGVSKINRTIMYPGDEFSVYEAASPFTKENGYELAGSYANGTTVESFGGGICQVSTTLYNAAIRAELEVLKRYNHSMAVHYVKPSEDAAIAGTYKDFRFRNNLDHPIYIQGYCEGGRIYFNIYGKETRPANREVSFESEVVKTIEPETKVVYTADEPVGYVETTQGAHTGYEARLWKVVTVDGSQESREIFNTSHYDASPTVITVGTGGASKEQLSAIKAAAGDKSADSIRSAAGAVAKDKDEKKKEEEKSDKKKEEKADKSDTKTSSEDKKETDAEADADESSAAKADSGEENASPQGESGGDAAEDAGEDGQ